MIITSIRILNSLGSPSDPSAYVDFKLNVFAGDNGYILKGVSGFGPSANIEFTEGFDDAGNPIKTVMPEKKELQLKIGFNPGAMGSYSSLRERLYKLIARPVMICLMSDETVVARIYGSIRSPDFEVSTNSPELLLLIPCTDGLFVAPTATVIPTAGLSKSNPVFSNILGTAPTGIEVSLVLTSNLSTFGFNNMFGVGGGEAWHFDVDYTFLNGDQIDIVTNYKERRFTVTRAGIPTDITGYLNSGSMWPKLYPSPEVNQFFTTSPNFNWVSVAYYARYWGL